jgi:uncharacterized protein
VKVIIDTNVLISAILRDKTPEDVIIWILSRRDWAWIASEEILLEYRQVLRRPKFNFPESIIKEWETLFNRDILLVPVLKELDFERDPRDAHLLSCAISNQADYLISGDKDMDSARKVLKTIILSPDAFQRLICDAPG